MGLMRRRAELRVLSALMVAGAGCASNAVRSQSPAEIRLQEAVQGLCRAEALAREGDVPGARAAFVNRSHTYLHELAADVTDRDPAAAAALLEAKQRVEAALGDPTDGARLAELVADLLDTVDAAAGAAGLAETRCIVGVA
jgi:hypothetical protein